MLFQVNYTARVGGSAADIEASSKRGLALYGKWTPGFEVKSFHIRADGKGGTIVVETDDVGTIVDSVSKFNSINEVEIVPIMDVGEALPIYSEALAWVDSIT